MMFQRKPARSTPVGRTAGDAVASGAPYAVIEVNGHPTGDISEFLNDGLVFLARFGGRQVTVRGAAHGTDYDTVVVHEKDCDGTGKDVRTWTVRTAPGGLVAEPRSIF